MIDNPMPPDDILNGIRHIAAWEHWFSAKVGKKLGDERRRSYLGNKLRSIMSELEIAISCKESSRVLKNCSSTSFFFQKLPFMAS